MKNRITLQYHKLQVTRLTSFHGVSDMSGSRKCSSNLLYYQNIKKPVRGEKMIQREGIANTSTVTQFSHWGLDTCVGRVPLSVWDFWSPWNWGSVIKWTLLFPGSQGSLLIIPWKPGPLEARAAMGSGLCLSSIDTCTSIYIYIHTYLYIYNLGQINCTPCPPPSLPVGICSALGVTKIKPSCIQPESITIHPWKPRLYKNMPWETRE